MEKKQFSDRQTKETTYDGSPEEVRATNREIDKQKKLVDRYAKNSIKHQKKKLLSYKDQDLLVEVSIWRMIITIM